MFPKATVRMDIKPDKVKDNVESDDVKSGAWLVVVEVDVHEQFANK